MIDPAFKESPTYIKLAFASYIFSIFSFMSGMWYQLLEIPWYYPLLGFAGFFSFAILILIVGSFLDMFDIFKKDKK